MDVIVSAAIVGVFVLAAAFLWPAMYAFWTRAVAETELNFWRVARHRGLKREDFAGREAELARAAYHCIACRESARCDATLAAGREGAVRVFCPNTGLLDRVSSDLTTRR